MARRPESAQAAALWTWSAILAGVVTSLIIQALLTMLALGVGLFSLDLPTAASAPITVSTAALLYWIASGIFAAFVGGAVAGAYAPVDDDSARSVHAVAAWAVAALIVLAVGAFTAGSTSAISANMAGPNSAISSRVAAMREQPNVQLTAAQAEQLRKAFAATMLASVVGLLAGAVAAGAGGYWGREMADEMGVPAGRRV